uniref:Uncharacterized protein n=1 Tax=Arundo donax TaxID=35708 RepID=A0A0A9G7A7_ARUDO
MSPVSAAQREETSFTLSESAQLDLGVSAADSASRIGETRPRPLKSSSGRGRRLEAGDLTDSIQNSATDASVAAATSHLLQITSSASATAPPTARTSGRMLKAAAVASGRAAVS